MLPYLLDIGFLTVRIWDVLDILIVAYLIFSVYKLLRGSIAFNIFIGVITLFFIWWVVGALKMDLLTALLNQFVSVGVIILIIVFQPEVRRFLLLLGNNTLRRRSNLVRRLLDRNWGAEKTTRPRQAEINEIKSALLSMSRKKCGALVVLAKDMDMEVFSNTGIQLKARISKPLLESIFSKESPLHDGAVVVTNHLVEAASCILPVSDTTKLPQSLGLRHRAALGITERLGVVTFVVSEENGIISFAWKGKLERPLDEARLEELLLQHYE